MYKEKGEYQPQIKITRESAPAIQLMRAILMVKELRGPANTLDDAHNVYMLIKNAVGGELLERCKIANLPDDPDEGMLGIAKILYENGLQAICSDLITDMEKKMRETDPRASLNRTPLGALRSIINTMDMRRIGSADSEDEEILAKYRHAPKSRTATKGKHIPNDEGPINLGEHLADKSL
ncbi:MAG: hypothetical protein HY564_00160 [Candidatus Jacksonbacteria bacterium]|nr:hypothetical protein [Candidatus Jacksonbacteria bacterium]